MQSHRMNKHLMSLNLQNVGQAGEAQAQIYTRLRIVRRINPQIRETVRPRFRRNYYRPAFLISKYFE